MYKARIVNDRWLPIELSKLKYIWKNNLTCLTILKAKSLHLEISNIILDWGRKENARALNLVFKELFDIRIANGLEKLNLFYLNQLTDSKNQYLLSWPEIKIRLGGKTRGKKPKWFTNQFGSSISLLEISNDKRKKEWALFEEVSEVAKLETRIEKCSGYEHNRSIVEGNCTTCIRFDVGWKVIPKNTINPSENEQEFKNLRSLESPEKELILQAKLKKN
ncbi:35137_t:CDS:2 [Gigaspora margarita]|uniref:35137_t:CDS:1 n=1 Tax=Gigaspora margarita TaxID=4874 RepID=A0ABN7UP36_GIGMA|nr:35137_t:CDS:2 [Gigaspora margarita]